MWYNIPMVSQEKKIMILFRACSECIEILQLRESATSALTPEERAVLKILVNAKYGVEE